MEAGQGWKGAWRGKRLNADSASAAIIAKIVCEPVVLISLPFSSWFAGHYFLYDAAFIESETGQ